MKNVTLDDGLTTKERQRFLGWSVHMYESALPWTDRQAADILSFAHEVYRRNHAHGAPSTRKSVHFIRILRLLARFPSECLLGKRIDLLATVLQDSRQRPVVEQAALMLLAGELKERWFVREAFRARVLRAAEGAYIEVLALMALRAEIAPEQARAQRERLRNAGADDKRLRMVELVRLVDAYEDERAAERLVGLAYEAIFENTTSEFRAALMRRMLRELRERQSMEKHRRWRLVLDPLVAQNRGDVVALTQIAQMVLVADVEDAEPYLAFYLDAVPEPSREVLEFLETQGTQRIIPVLYPWTEEKGLFGFSTSVARGARRALERIVEREGLESGALTVAAGDGGALSLVHATRGALTIGDAHTSHALVRTRSPSRTWVGVVLVALVLAVVLVFFLVL